MRRGQRRFARTSTPRPRRRSSTTPAWVAGGLAAAVVAAVALVQGPGCSRTPPAHARETSVVTRHAAAPAPARAPVASKPTVAETPASPVRVTLAPEAATPPARRDASPDSGAPNSSASKTDTHVVMQACNRPFMFGFTSWQSAPKFPVTPDGIHIAARDGKGGAGLKVTTAPADREFLDWSPTLSLRLHDRNKATRLRLVLQDGDGTKHAYDFDLPKQPTGAKRTLTANDGASLAEPAKVDAPGAQPGLDVATLTLAMIIGQWSADPVDVTVASVGLAPPTPEMKAQRERLAKRRNAQAKSAREKAEAKAKSARDLVEKGAPHPADGVVPTYVCAVAPDVLAVTIQAGRHANNELKLYEAQPGDEIKDEKGTYHAVENGKVVERRYRAVYRRVNGKPTSIGMLTPDGTQLSVGHKTIGQLLDERAVDRPGAYTIRSADDAAYAEPTPPVAVYRKGKPNGHSKPLPFLYTISLRLPRPLKDGATYTVEFVGVNTSERTITYTHAPRRTRSLAIHALQTGYRPDDPFKRAYVSFWMGVHASGTQAGCTPPVDKFELLDKATGRTVFTGRAELAKKEGDEERLSIHEKLDYTRATVYRLDFSSFATPGEYLVHVPGIGTSFPVRVARDVWDVPFKAAMQGILSQRQGIDLGPPYTAFRRKRAFHPDDGVEFYQLSITTAGGQEGGRGKNMIELAKAGKLKRTTITPGAYQDAGDWDTLSHHLSTTYDLLGLYLLNPEAVKRTRLVLPAPEMNNRIPDIVDEALWQMPTWRSQQMPDGGVRGGYGYGWGCPKGQTSSMIKSAGVYAADIASTLRYAAAAARAARVLADFDTKLSGEYLASARRAWGWVEAEGSKQTGWPRVHKSVVNKRAAAAVELLAATEDPAFDKAFHESSELSKKASRYLEQPKVDFAYARLPDGLGDPELKKRAVERITTYADHAIDWSRKNAFDIVAGRRTDLPMIFACTWFSTPAQGGFITIYAYELTKDPKYLAAAVQGANYSLGANPDDLSYCSGVGYNPQHFPFMVDVHVSGQHPDVPVGHIPYGQGNEGNSMSRRSNGWVQKWVLNFQHAKKMVPNWFEWPVNEQYIDFGLYPLHNENCFNATSVPAACYWFWLASRSEVR